MASITLVLTQCSRTNLARTGKPKIEGTGPTADVIFNLDWPNSFRNDINWDAVWIFAKYRADGGPWRHAALSTDPGDFSVVNDNGIPSAFETVPDGRGVFAFRASPGAGPVSWNQVSVKWHAAENDVTLEDSEVDVRVYAIEVVYVPEGRFHPGDGEVGDVRGHFRSASETEPFAVTGEGPIPLGGSDFTGLSTNSGYGMNPSFLDDFSDRAPTTLPQSFPKGYAPFYIMKHELTEGLYAQFLNALDDSQQYELNPANHQPEPRPGVHGYGLSTVAPFISSVPDRPATWLTWANAAALADWAGLRPMTELEFEKAARGTNPPVAGEFAWGETEIADAPYSVLQINTPEERIVDPPILLGNALYARTGGFIEGCASCRYGPLRTGAFLTLGTDRSATGGSYYGVLELSGNLWERVVTVGNAAGRRFDGSHGDGEINEHGRAAGPEVMMWPGTSNTGLESQIIGSVGTGLRGGGWDSPAPNLRVSDREFAATPDNRRNPRYGYRFVRTARTPPAPAMPDSTQSP